jgi:hypothetical protein
MKSYLNHLLPILLEKVVRVMYFALYSNTIIKYENGFILNKTNFYI